MKYLRLFEQFDDEDWWEKESNFDKKNLPTIKDSIEMEYEEEEEEIEVEDYVEIVTKPENIFNGLIGKITKKLKRGYGFCDLWCVKFDGGISSDISSTSSWRNVSSDPSGRTKLFGPDEFVVLNYEQVKKIKEKEKKIKEKQKEIDPFGEEEDWWGV